MEELEVSFELKNSIEEAQKKLKDLKFIEEQNITDVYFYDPNKYTSKPSGDRELRECLRLRNINGKYIVSYKIDKFNDKDEYVYSDNTFKEIDDPKVALTQFNEAGLKELVTLKKKRYCYKHNSYSVYLEEIDSLGNFLEVEKMCTEKAHFEKVKKDLAEYAKSLNLKIGEVLDCGKPELMIKKLNIEIK